MTDLPTPTPPAPGVLARRTVLAGVVAVGAGSALAACGSDSGGTASSVDSTTGSEASPGSSTAAPQSGTGEVLAPVADVPVGGGVITSALVVTQPTEGEFRAFTNVCTHQACVVSSVADGSINCACHGSRFSIEDGSVQNGPATAPLSEVDVTVDGTDVVLA